MEETLKQVLKHLLTTVQMMCFILQYQVISSVAIDRAFAALGEETLNPSSFRTIGSDMDSKSEGLPF